MIVKLYTETTTYDPVWTDFNIDIHSVQGYWNIPQQVVDGVAIPSEEFNIIISGNVVTGNFVHIGTGAVVIQGVKIGANALVGAGATATRNLLHNEKLLVAKPYLIQKKILD